MYQVLSWNTGNNPAPEILFEGTELECKQYVKDNNIPMEGDRKFPSGIGVEIVEDPESVNDREQEKHDKYLSETLHDNGEQIID